ERVRGVLGRAHALDPGRDGDGVDGLEQRNRHPGVPQRRFRRGERIAERCRTGEGVLDERLQARIAVPRDVGASQLFGLRIVAFRAFRTFGAFGILGVFGTFGTFRTLIGFPAAFAIRLTGRRRGRRALPRIAVGALVPVAGDTTGGIAYGCAPERRGQRRGRVGADRLRHDGDVD